MAPSPIIRQGARPGADLEGASKRSPEGGAGELTAKVHKKLGRGFVLDAEFQAPPGFTILFGASGSGKTTLLHCIAGLHRPEAGRVALGRRILFDSDRDINVPVPARRVGYVFQDQI